MKIIASLAASLLLTAVLLSFLPVHGEEIVYENTIRLHVLAESDSPEEQALKLKVRDAVLAHISPLLEDCTDHLEACRLLEEECERIKATAEETIKANGYAHTASAELVWEEYPTRVYEDVSLPSGQYTSLKIIIGKGAGKNWWCVLFPSICNSFSIVKEAEKDEGTAEADYIAAGFTPEQYRMIQKDSSAAYKVRFKILEMLSDILGFEY